MPRPTAIRMTNEPPPAGTALFLIGMKVTKPWHLRAWLSVFIAMPRMLRYLQAHPEAGMLSARLCKSRRLVQRRLYWRSATDLQRFAADPDAPHLPAWRWFTKIYADRDKVGIWHETYVIGDHEAISSGMPPYGLTAAVGARAHRARHPHGGRQAPAKHPSPTTDRRYPRTGIEAGTRSRREGGVNGGRTSGG